MRDWWGSLRHGGLLISPSRLAKYFPGTPLPLPGDTAEHLRAALTRFDATPDAADAGRLLLDVVFEQVCAIGAVEGSGWTRGAAVDARFSRHALTGESVRPRRVWQGPNGAILPIFVDAEPRLGVGRGRRSVARVVEWLRAGGERVALVTNHRQFRLVYAGLDHEAWAEWDTSLWLEAGGPSAQVDALRMLLSPRTLIPAAAGQPSLLVLAIEETRRGQSELSAELGERVRAAVERLIQEHGPALDALRDVDRRDVYIAATRVVMRLIVLLFAEARDLLPRENPVYYASYGLQGLRDALERGGGGTSPARLRDRHAAWPRILALFRLLYDGSHHPELPVPRYGGGLFSGGAPGAASGVERALSVFEDPAHSPSDAAVFAMLDLLARTEMRVQVGRTARPVSAPVDFADLSSEYIGILYEGLLDYELRRAEGDAIVFLKVGDEPALPLSRLEEMSDEALKPLVEKLKKKARLAPAGEEEGAGESEEDEGQAGEDGEEEEDESAQILAAVEEADEAVGGPEVEEESGAEAWAEEDAAAEPGGEQAAFRDRAHAWARRAVMAGGLVPRPRSRRRQALEEYERAVGARAEELIGRLVLPGEWYLVRWGGTRKGAGTFYTRPQLAVPTVQRTLRPLAFDAPGGDENAPAAGWSPKEPEAILSLKVCDPAIGSGSFGLAALRFLTDALWQSLAHHNWIVQQPDRLVVTGNGERPPWFVECVRDLPIDAPDPEAHIRPRLKRLVVERCLYGVDIDPLAIELARLSLWVETMDRTLPFEFLDHKLKVGNALVGTWFDRVRDYPVLAWERKAGDEEHERFVHHFREYTVTRGKAKGQNKRSGDPWAAALRDFRENRVKPALRDWLLGQQSLFSEVDGRTPEALHDEALALFEELHALPIHDSEARGTFYRDRIERSAALTHLRERFDAWCALWFWPADRLDVAPLPDTFERLSDDARAVVQALRREHRFFHWELEFPDVFAQAGSGFSAIVGNPPWETLQPNSKEFFSNVDPLYRAYGKQEALTRQKQYFERSAEDERSWISYVARYKALSNWNKHVGSPFGDGLDGGEQLSLGRQGAMLLADWVRRREHRGCYADRRHPFIWQGQGKPYTYKMFLEAAHALLRNGGRVGMLVPSGIYSDHGSSRLRTLMMERCRWERLYAFQNERFVFTEVHHSFKIAVLWFEKAVTGQSLRMRFRLGPGDSPEAHELAEDILEGTRFLHVSTHALRRLSPLNRAVLEIRSGRDLEVLERISASSVLLGAPGPNGWGIRYAQGDFNMTTDSALFPPRPHWEARGYRPDEYGRWIKFKSKEVVDTHCREVGWIRLADGSAVVHESAIEDFALPLYEGRLFNTFDFAFKGWVSGTGTSAAWEELPWSAKAVRPQYLLSQEDANRTQATAREPKVGYRNIARSTDTRSFIGTVLVRDPTPNMTSILRPADSSRAWELCGYVTSFAFDYVARTRIGGTHFDYHLIAEFPLPQQGCDALNELVLRLANPNQKFAPEWLERFPRPSKPWLTLWPLTAQERLRLRAQVDAIVAVIYGLEVMDFSWVLRDCDHPVEKVCSKSFARTLDPKGFWRVDKEKDPELRHTVLTLVAFHDLKEMIAAHGGDRDEGIAAFCNQNDGDGWMLPDRLRLSDYALGHDERARQPQPVRERLGERFLPWQLEQSVEESWAECERHARNLLGEEGFAKLKAEIAAGAAYPEHTPRHAVAAERRLESAPDLPLFGRRED
jgi:hypothetical protein